MAKETAAQRKERHALELQMREAAAAADYSRRLMAALEKATSFPNFLDLKVLDGNFVVTDINENEIFTLSPAWVRDDWHLENLESHLNIKEHERQEAMRKLELKNAALAKLSPEERAVLGL